ncbi:uncharacterized protein LOC118623370 [Molossus molossus]|uniref:uncharacterized protein LOC118623370 n=1 Tax=Molossus molossus TaxID=27622 RepID=UPI0017461AC4|nr:uncharacterized protein LOC118623370 [Molossus molossus]
MLFLVTKRLERTMLFPSQASALTVFFSWDWQPRMEEACLFLSPSCAQHREHSLHTAGSQDIFCKEMNEELTSHAAKRPGVCPVSAGVETALCFFRIPRPQSGMVPPREYHRSFSRPEGGLREDCIGMLRLHKDSRASSVVAECLQQLQPLAVHHRPKGGRFPSRQHPTKTCGLHSGSQCEVICQALILLSRVTEQELQVQSCYSDM